MKNNYLQLIIYSISLVNGELNWIKNHETPIKSTVRVYDDKIFIINQDNRLVSFNTSGGSLNPSTSYFL